MPKQSRRKIKAIECEVIHLVGGVTAEGAEACFFSMSSNSKFGIKVYDSWEEAEGAWLRQKKAHKLGMAPAVGKMLIVKYQRRKNWKNTTIRFGYETEIAERVKNAWRNPIWSDQCEKLENRLIKTGLAGGDFRPDNCGIINGRLIQVDFGECSCHSSKYLV